MLGTALAHLAVSQGYRLHSQGRLCDWIDYNINEDKLYVLAEDRTTLFAQMNNTPRIVFATGRVEYKAYTPHTYMNIFVVLAFACTPSIGLVLGRPKQALLFVQCWNCPVGHSHIAVALLCLEWREEIIPNGGQIN